MSPADIDHLEVVTLHAATRLATRHPRTTEEAQYSLPFAVATTMVHGTITATDLAAPRTRHPEVSRLSASIILTEKADYEALFPAERHAHIDVVLRDGTRLPGVPTTAKGGPEDPLTDVDVRAKFIRNSDVLDGRQTQAIQISVAAMPHSDSIAEFLDLLLSARTAAERR